MWTGRLAIFRSTAGKAPVLLCSFSSTWLSRRPAKCTRTRFGRNTTAVRQHYGHNPRSRIRCAIVAVCLVAALVGGCASTSEWVKVRDTPRNPLAGTLKLVSRGGPKPTDRTTQLLRRYDLESELHGDRASLLARLEDIQRREPNREHEYAMAEVSYITATQSEKLHRRRALQFYGTALIHAYRYLFDYKDDVPGRREALAINPYDPQFRGASDLYNQSLEG